MKSHIILHAQLHQLIGLLCRVIHLLLSLLMLNLKHSDPISQQFHIVLHPKKIQIKGTKFNLLVLVLLDTAQEGASLLLHDRVIILGLILLF